MTPASHALAVRHRSAQLALRASTLAAASKILPAFDVTRIVDSWPPVEAGLIPLIQSRAIMSGNLSRRYYEAASDLALGSSTAAASTSRFPLEQITTSLRFVGPHRAGVAMSRGIDPELVTEDTDVSILGSVGRYVLDGGRDVLVDSVRNDPNALGWERMTSGEPCDFCQELSDRGTVYSESGADFEAHDHCACFPVPAFA